MNFRIEDCSTDTKFIAKVIFDDDVTSYFALDNYDVNILELTTGESRELEPDTEHGYLKDISFGNFGLRTGCPDFNLYMESNLSNNKGIVMFLAANNELDIYLIPRSRQIDDDEYIGFNNCRVKIVCGYGVGEGANDLTSIEINAPLYPRIIRDPNIEKYDPSQKDPILPSGISRSCYTYPEISNKNMVKHNITYNTDDSIYVNTYLSADNINFIIQDYDTGISDLDELDLNTPIYVSKLSAYFLADDPAFKFEDSVKESYLYNNLNNTQIPIKYSANKGQTTEFEVMKQFQNLPYSAATNCYEVEQLIYTSALGYYKNELTFNISATVDNFARE
jgi:hypothetical protein